MYIPGHFEQHDRAQIRALVRQCPLATVVSTQEGQLCADHIPVYCVEASEPWLLHMHVARNNPLWRQVEAGAPLLLVFHTPGAYVSPGWYSTPGVPTWNYAAVHLHVVPRAVQEDELRALVQTQVADAEQRWSPATGVRWDDDRDGRLLGRIGGAQLRVVRVEAKFKLSQNRAPDERHNVMHQLSQQADSAAQAVAALMAGADRPQGIPEQDRERAGGEVPARKTRDM